MTNAAKKLPVEAANTLPAEINLDINSVKIAELAVRSSNVPEDLTDQDNYRMAQDIINEARTMRGQIKTKGNGLKEDARAWQKRVVAEEKRLDGEIVKFLDPLAARKKVFDDQVAAEKERKRIAEQVRKDAHLANINSIRILISKAQNQSSEVIEQVIAELETMIIDEDYEEFQKDAEDVRDDTELALQRMLITTQNQEDADRKRIEEDARLKAEKDKLDADRAELKRLQDAAAEVTRQNELAAEENKKQAEKLAEPAKVELVQESQIEQPAVRRSISPAAKNVAEECSVIAKARQNTLEAISSVISNFGGGNNLALAEDMLSAIQNGVIPNVKYDIF